MKNAWKKMIETIKNGDYTTREAVLTGICLFLFGILIGVFCSPRKYSVIGSNNGNNNNGTFDGDFLEEEEEE